MNGSVTSSSRSSTSDETPTMPVACSPGSVAVEGVPSTDPAVAGWAFSADTVCVPEPRTWVDVLPGLFALPILAAVLWGKL